MTGAGDENLGDFPRLAQHFLGFLRESHQMVLASNEHSDRMLTWMIGLMGGGLVSIYQLVVGVPWCIRAVVLGPWLLGILVALTSRGLGAELRLRNNTDFMDRTGRLGPALLQDDPRVIRDELGAVLEDKGAFGPQSQALKRLRRWANGLYDAAHVLFALGVMAAGIAAVMLSASDASR